MSSDSMPWLDKQDTLIYRVRPGAARGPLLLLLHGLGGDEYAMSLFTRSIPAAFTVLAPRAPVPLAPGMFPGYTDRGYSWLRSSGPADRAAWTATLPQVQQLLQIEIERGQLDPDRVFIMGFSQGAALSYVLSFEQPQRIAGVIALAGFLPAGFAPTALPRAGYLIVHGLDDQIVPVERAHYARDFLRARGASVDYHAYPGGHKVAAPGLKDITRWLTAASSS